MKRILMVLGLAACGAAMGDAALEASIARGARYLLGQQDAAGFWSDRQMPALTALISSLYIEPMFKPYLPEENEEMPLE